MLDSAARVKHSARVVLSTDKYHDFGKGARDRRAIIVEILTRTRYYTMNESPLLQN